MPIASKPAPTVIEWPTKCVDTSEPVGAGLAREGRAAVALNTY